MRAKLISCAVVTAVAALTASLTASASFPGANGAIVFQSNRAGGPPELYLQNEDGTGVRRLTFNNAVDRMPRFSPDGRRIVFASNRDGNVEIYVMELTTGATIRVTNDPAWDDQPVFTEDGRHLVWQRTQNAPFACPCSIWTADLDGDDVRQVDTGPGDALMPDLSPNGKKLTFTSVNGGISAIYIQRLYGRGRRQVLPPPSGSADFRSRWSPNGRDLVFARDDGSNNNDLYTVHHDGTRLTQLTSGPRFDEHASFSPDGKRILFSVFPPDGSGRLYTIRRDGTDERALPQLGAIAERFDGPELDSAAWWEHVTGTGGDVAQTGGRVELSLAPDASGDPGSGFMGPSFGTQCSAVGDYDARVSFELLDWPAANGTHANFGDAGLTGSIGRRSEAIFEDYLAFFNPLTAAAPTDHQSGTLRLVRSGSTLTAYFSDAGMWVPLLSGPAATTPARLSPQLFSSNALFGHAFVRVAFDDFHMTADEFACPSWWRDSGADWQPIPHGGGGGDDDDGMSKSDARLLDKYQPVLVFHPDEQFRPTKIQRFVEDSELERFVGSSPQQLPLDAFWTVVDPDPEPGDLPAAAPGAFVRLDQKSCEADAPLAGRDCYAAAVGKKKHGRKVAMYGRAVRTDTRIVLQYWLFYYDNPLLLPPTPVGTFWQSHEGDWEVVNVVLDHHGQPVEVAYSQHCSGQRKPWPAVTKSGSTHPVAYVALGSHANYFAPGTGSLGAIPISPACIPAAVAPILPQLPFLQVVDQVLEGPYAKRATIRRIEGKPWASFGGRWGESEYFFTPIPLGPIPAGAVPIGLAPASPALQANWNVQTVLAWPAA